MTSLEKLIKLGLTDASELYRRTAQGAQKELEELKSIKREYEYILREPPLPPLDAKPEDFLEEIIIQRPAYTMCVEKSSGQNDQWKVTESSATELADQEREGGAPSIGPVLSCPPANSVDN